MIGLSYFLTAVILIAMFYLASLIVHTIFRLEFEPLSTLITSICSMIVVLLVARGADRNNE